MISWKRIRLIAFFILWSIGTCFSVLAIKELLFESDHYSLRLDLLLCALLLPLVCFLFLLGWFVLNPENQKRVFTLSKKHIELKLLFALWCAGTGLLLIYPYALTQAPRPFDMALLHLYTAFPFAWILLPVVGYGLYIGNHEDARQRFWKRSRFLFLAIVWGIGVFISAGFITDSTSSDEHLSNPVVFYYYLVIPCIWILSPILWFSLSAPRFFFVLSVSLLCWALAGIPLDIPTKEALLFFFFLPTVPFALACWPNLRHRILSAFAVAGLWLLGGWLCTKALNHYITSTYPSVSFRIDPTVIYAPAFASVPLMWTLFCSIASLPNKKRHLLWLLTPLMLLLFTFSPLPFQHFNWFWCPEGEIPREELAVTSDDPDDLISPPFINSEAFWTEIKPAEESDLPIRCLINTTGASYQLWTFRESFSKASEIAENRAKSKLHPSFAAAVRAMPKDSDEKVLPSLQMMQFKAKSFENRFLAALDSHRFLHSSALNGGLYAFATQLLNTLRDTQPGSEERDRALAFLATGLDLGQKDIPELPEKAEQFRTLQQKDFLRGGELAKPIGFYQDTEELKALFQASRFYQKNMTIPVALQLNTLFKTHPELYAHYERLLTLERILNNAPATFSVADLQPYLHLAADPAALATALCTSPKGQELLSRHPNDMEDKPTIALFPGSTSRENELFIELYSGSSHLPWENVMNRFIKAVQSGERSLAPNADSGWFDYKSYSLEPLLLPERAQEKSKLCMNREYKKHLLESFKTALTQQHETHIRAIPPVFTMGCPEIYKAHEEFILRPTLSVEPNATYLLRTARAFRFLRNALCTVLPEEELRQVSMKNAAGKDESLLEALENINQLFYGLYLQVCADIGMQSTLEDGEIATESIESTRQIAKQWLNEILDDPVFEQDTRYATPVLAAPNQKKARYWATLGVKIITLSVSFIDPPAVRLQDTKTNKILFEKQPKERHDLYPRFETEDGKDVKFLFKGQSYLVPVQIFAEANGPLTPLTRTEFRALCDKHKTQEKILFALEKQSSTPPWHWIGFVLFGLMVAFFLYGYIALRRKQKQKHQEKVTT